MMAFGMQLNASGNRPKLQPDQVHADRIWARYESYRSGRPQGASYALPVAPNPFQNWDVGQRYAHQSNFDQVRAGKHQAAARDVGLLIRTAKLGGLI